MKIRDIMTLDPITLRPDQTVGEAAIIFMENKIDGAPVVNENGELIGLFTKSHVYRVVNGDRDFDRLVSQMMSTELRTGRPEDEFSDVVNSTLPRLPVVNEHGLVVGMCTRGDIAKAFFDSYQNISLELDVIINSAHNVIVSIDQNGLIRVWNRAAERNFGEKATDVIGQRIQDILPESDMTNVIHTGIAEPLKKVELKNQQFLSNRSPIIKEGEIVGVVAVLMDISELESVSRELQRFKELNRELDAIIDSSFDGLYITDGAGLTLRLNKAYERITGISADEFIGKNVAAIESEGIVSESVTARVLEKRHPVTISQEMRTGKKTLATGNPVFDEVGNIFRVVSNIRDITELNALKQKLEEIEGLSQHYETQLRTLKLIYAGSDNIVTTSNRMKSLLSTVIRLAQYDSTILITGESGTGKELVAEVIHNNSTRRNQPFIKVNCGAIPETLLESELFGYDYGAFTGAKKEGKPGYFQLASGGTLFLDEIGDLPYNLQVKLLRVLQNKEITRVGGTKPIQIDARIVTGTNQNLLELVEKKLFREDLYYRLNVVPINVPPLRDRIEDIPPLVAHFTKLYNRKHKLNRSFDPDVIDVFMGYNWPGNVRELENLIERLIVVSTKNLMTTEDLPAFLVHSPPVNAEVMVSGIIPLQDAVENGEKQILQQAYQKYRTTRQMATVLKVDASTVVRKAAKYGISHSKNL
ncbi:MAG: sigma 54-interacting transcriptional regulator [Syntrophomonadaceae bacterium]|nr:sigma 54-interacting transcriptional regulator [Syntrophomonadaceae bacterium]